MATNDVCKINQSSKLIHGCDSDLYCDLIIATSTSIEIPTSIITKHGASMILTKDSSDKDQIIAHIICKNYETACSCFDDLKAFYKNRG